MCIHSIVLSHTILLLSLTSYRHTTRCALVFVAQQDFSYFKFDILKMHGILQKCQIWIYRNPGGSFELNLNTVFSSGNKVKAVGAELQMGMMMMMMMRMVVMMTMMVVVMMTIVMMMIIVVMTMMVMIISMMI